jgi:hypothetical protein
MGIGGEHAIPGTRDALTEHLGVEVAGRVIPLCAHPVAEEQPEAMVAMLRPSLAQHAR